VGVVVGIGISLIISLPLSKLVKQMSLLENMQLEKVKEYPLSSLSEIATLQIKFYRLVNRLKEYRAYFPAYVLSRDYADEEDGENTHNDNTLSTHTYTVTNNTEVLAKLERKFNVGLSLGRATVMKVHVEYNDADGAMPVSDIVRQHGIILRDIEMAAVATQAIITSFSERSFTLYWKESGSSNQLACQCAIMIRDNFSVMKERLQRESSDPNYKGATTIAIGIDNNECYYGNIGIREKKQFVVYGACHNIAKHISRLCQEWSTVIHVTYAVAQNVTLSENYSVTPIAKIQLDEIETDVYQIADRVDPIW
jgi:hypothetical protein